MNFFPAQPTGKLQAALATVRCLVGLYFIAGAGSKLLGVPMIVAEFDQLARYGLGQWLRYFIAALEILSVIKLISPRTTGFGAALLVGISFGALIAQLALLHHDIIHVVIVIPPLLWLIYAYRGFVLSTLMRRETSTKELP